MTDKSEAGERGKRREEERTKPRGFGVGNLGAEACWGAEGGLFITRHGVLLSALCNFPPGDRREEWNEFPL